MNIGDKIKKVREAKGLSQKQIAITLKMDQAQYSRIENNKTDPSFSSVYKIANALGVELSELFISDEIFKEINSADKTLMEKLRLLDSLDEEEKSAVYKIIDGLISKKKLKETLSNALEKV
ncbi:MAG: helix-turn-helix transcriptional regulator [bacterium]|nr:helix-turn-helix transcriptional regulator [bacterium]